MSTNQIAGPNQRLDGQRVALVGRLAGMTQRETQAVIRQHGGILVGQTDPRVSLLVVGDEALDSPGAATDEPLAGRADSCPTSAPRITETELWKWLGLVDSDSRLYTPAMLADLLSVPLPLVRRWHRKGLIVATREVKRLPYFDFAEVSTAQRLAELLAAGCSAPTIERKLSQLHRMFPDVARPLAELSVVVEGKQLLIRQGDELVEPGGQLRLDFEGEDETSQADEVPTVPLAAASLPHEADALLEMAIDLEDDGRLAEAGDMYRAVLSVAGSNAQVNFALAELLYRTGDLTAARERYHVAIELDEDYVEARSNLGCVLAELGQRDLAVAAFQGALAHHDDYPDVHFHLARILDDLDRADEARWHWDAFLRLAPGSPWAEQARTRLGAALVPTPDPAQS